MKILVTGGAGFIASHIVDAYLAAGHEVVVIDRSKKNLNHKVKFYDMSIEDKELEKVFEQEQPDMVNHHAAQTAVGESVTNPHATLHCNVTGTINILENCRKHGVKKIIFSSSAAIYGDQKELPIKEDAAKNMLSPYGVSKYGAELYLRCYQKLYGLSFVIFRYSNVYGPRQQNGVIATWTEKLQLGKPCRIFGDGKQTRDFVHVKDVVAANVLALEKGEACVVNISSQTEVSMEALFEMMKKIHGSGELLKQDSREGEILKSSLDNSLAKKELGWVPKVELEQGLQELLVP